MPEPLFYRQKVLTFKPETTYGTDAAPTAGANAILCQNVRIMPMEGADVSRALDTPYMGAQATIPNELHAKFTFEVELAGSGEAGTAPALGVILRACGLAEVVTAGTSVTYSPITTGHESATIWHNQSGTVYKSIGARGTAKVKVDAQGIAKLEVEMMGLFTQPAAQTVPNPDYTSWQKPLVATTANTPVFTINSVSLVMRTFTMDIGNQLQGRFLVGAERIIIEDKAELIETTVEAVPLATLNPYVLAAGQSTVPVVLTHGTAAGNIVTLNAPTAQMQRPTGVENQQGIVEWPLRLVPLPDEGNDQFTIIFT